MNPNESHQIIGGRQVYVKGCTSMSSHVLHVWKKYVIPSGVGSILIIAHSAGGGCVNALISEDDHFYDRVKQIAYTDSSVPNIAEQLLNKSFFKNNAVHYEGSS